MKVQFTFEHDEPELLAIYQQAEKTYSVLHQFDNWLRNRAKHNDCIHSARHREMLHQLIAEYGVDLEVG